MKIFFIIFLLINLSYGLQEPNVSIQTYPTSSPEIGDTIQLKMKIVSPVNVSYVEIKLNCPSNLKYGNISFGGFLNGSIEKSGDQYLKFENIPLEDYSEGNLSIPLKSNEKTSINISIDEINLKGNHIGALIFKELPKINIQWTEPLSYESGIKLSEEYRSEKEISATKIADKAEIFKEEPVKIIFLIWNTNSKDIFITNISDFFPLKDSNFYQITKFGIKFPLRIAASKIGKIPYQEISSQIKGKATILPSIIEYKIDGEDDEKQLQSHPDIIEVEVKNRQPRICFFDLKDKNISALGDVCFISRAIDEDGIIDEIELLSSKDSRLYFDRPNLKTIDLDLKKHFNDNGERVITLRVKDNDGEWTEKELTINIPEPEILKISRFIVGGSIAIFIFSLLLVLIQLIVNWPTLLLRFMNLYTWFLTQSFARRFTIVIFLIFIFIIVTSIVIYLNLQLDKLMLK